LIPGQEFIHRVGEFTFAETETEMPGFLADLLEMPGNASKAMPGGNLSIILIGTIRNSKLKLGNTGKRKLKLQPTQK